MRHTNKVNSKRREQSAPGKKETLKKGNPFRRLDRGTDFVPRAITYAKEILADKKRERFNVWMQFAAKRFLNDLERAKHDANSFYFDPNEANKVCRFVELLPHVEGTWDTTNIVLEDAQIFFLVNLFGFRNHGTKARRFSSALYAVARKNAKSTLAAAIMLYVLCEESEPGGQLYSAATTGDQARAVYRIAQQMVERTWALRQAYDVEARSKDIQRYATGSFFKAINAKASTQDGLNPQAFVLDELHAHKTHDLLNVLRSAAGARRNPLFLYTTTEGYESPGPWAEVREFMQNILRGLEVDHFFGVYYSVDEENKELGTKADDDFDESKFRKANPLYNSNAILRKSLHDEATEAKAMPGKLGEFRIKRLNRRASAARAWVDLRKWLLCSTPLDLTFLRNYPCWGAFDLASTSDMCAWCLLWYVDGFWYAHVRYWVPREAATQRTERRSAPYAAWIEAGWVTATEGDVADYDVIEKQILDDVQTYQPIKVAYDSWNAQQTVNSLSQEGVELEMFVQGPKSYNPAMQALEIAYRQGKFAHGGNPVLAWNAANVVPRPDRNGNIMPDKIKSADKIDGMCCVCMAIGLAVRETGDDSAGFFAAPAMA